MITAQIAVDDSAPVLLAGEATNAGQDHRFVLVASGATVYIGDAAVTETTGFPVAAGGEFDDTLDPGEEVYGICGSGDTATVSVYEAGL